MHAATHPSTVTAVPNAARPRRSLGRRITLLMLLPSTLWFLLLLLMPLVIILVFSFGERSAVGGYAGGFTLANYLNLGSRAAAFGNTLMLAPLCAWWRLIRWRISWRSRSAATVRYC